MATLSSIKTDELRIILKKWETSFEKYFIEFG